MQIRLNLLSWRAARIAHRNDGRVLPIQLAELATQRRIPVVFDRIVRASRKQLGDLSPAIAQLPMGIKQDAVLCDTRA